jgi:flagellar basal body rod protein FlgB
MLFGFIDRVTNATPLRAALDRSVDRSRAIGDRVAKASLGNADGFALRAAEGDQAADDANPVDVEQEMMDLADEQLRFLTTAKLLERTYASVRTAIKGTGA